MGAGQCIYGDQSLARMAAIIFGVSVGGVGGALAKALRSAGQQVHVAGRNPEVLSSLRDLGCTSSIFDATDEQSIQDAVAAATASHGSLGSLAYCCGNIDLKPLSKLDPEGMLATFQVIPHT